MNRPSIINAIKDFVADPIGSTVEHSSYERFALPYKFQPRLRVVDAAMFALRTFLRIFLGSVLFGAWGAYSLEAWSRIHNPFLLTATLVPLFALFLGSLAVMLRATASLRPLRRP